MSQPVNVPRALYAPVPSIRTPAPDCPWLESNVHVENEGLHEPFRQTPCPEFSTKKQAVNAGLLSWLMSYVSFSYIDPRSGEPIVIVNQLTGSAITTFMTGFVTNFVTFGPIGTVLVAMLGIGLDSGNDSTSPR